MRSRVGSMNTEPSSPPPRLAQRPLPRRVRALLEGVLKFASDEVERGMRATLDEFEQQLFKLAEQARNSATQASCFEALREIKRGRSDLTPRFLIALEAVLASVRDAAPEPDPNERRGSFGELSLVADIELEENIVLNEISSRAEIRHSLPLFLLGQRFGVIAGKPAFESERLPIGPQLLCRCLRKAVHSLDLNIEYRLLLFRQFDRQVMQLIGSLYEAVNSYLAREKVLPHLSAVPNRARPASSAAISQPKMPAQAPPAGETTAPRGKSAPPSGFNPETVPHIPHVPQGGWGAPPGAVTGAGLPQGALPSGNFEVPHVPPGVASPFAGMNLGPALGQPMPPASTAASAPSANAAKPFTAWPGTTHPEPLEMDGGGNDGQMFDVLRQLLAGRRALLGKLSGNSATPPANAYTASRDDVQAVLALMQGREPPRMQLDGRPVMRSIAHVKQDMLAQLRQVTPPGQSPTLSPEHNDIVELLSLLFENISREFTPTSPAAQLLAKLQVPMLRVALSDKGFFTRRQHPARLMLNAVAETGATWLRDGEDLDQGLLDKLNVVVDKVTHEFNDDPAIFESTVGDLEQQMQTQARKAEVAERRHVEAARGKERLALARQGAEAAVAARLSGQTVPKFVSALLNQAWTDVLALSLLRGGEESPVYQRQIEIVDQLIRISTGQAQLAGAELTGLREDVEHALVKVGYHENDAAALVARLLTGPDDVSADEASTRTELALKLKSRTRLGTTGESHHVEPKPVLSADEQAQYDRIRHLPFGTWFEFHEDHGLPVRRRMSWFSTVTNNALFVNHRGQRAGEYDMAHLARLLLSGKASIVMAEQGTMIDRAWQSIMGALKSFSGKPTTEGASP